MSVVSGVISRQVLPVCGNLCFFCPARRARSRQPVKRYKKLIAEIFPRSQEEEPNDRKIGKLCEYASKNPLRIPKRISDDLEVIKAGCAKSFAPFPTGCMFHSEGGLMNFEHPMNKMKAMPRVDSEGVMCGANFKVDKYTRVNSIPRTGSEANWSEWDSH